MPEQPPTPAQIAALLDTASRLDASAAQREAAQRELSALFAAYQPRLYAACLRYVGDPELAAELAQDTMLTGWRRLADWTGEGSLFSWLYGIARFKSLRARQKKRELLTEDGVLEKASPEQGALRQLRRAERDEVLQIAAAALTALEQEAVHLRYERGLPIDDITALLQIEDKSGARGVLQRCRRKLRRHISEELRRRAHGTSLLFGSIGS